MISTRKRERITLEIDPIVTHKASGEAVAKGCTTPEILLEWLIERAGLTEEVAALRETNPDASKP